MKNYILTLAVLLGFSFGSLAQESKYASARIFENSGQETARIVLVYDGGTEIIPLNPWRATTARMNEVLTENQKIINKMLNDMRARGYAVSQMSISAEPHNWLTSVIFVEDGK